MIVADSARLSIALPTVSDSEGDHPTARRVLDVAVMLEESGVDRVVVPDHVAFGESLDAYGDPRLGGIEGGVQPTGPDGMWLEPLVMLAAVATVTSRVRLGTVVLQAALRRPIVLAKMATTLDVLSAGRLDLGVGVGWQQAEYDAAGLRFDQRGRLLDHTLSVCTELWRNRAASVSDGHLTFAGIHQMPKPLQPGGVPLWISGSFHPLVVERVARFGTGWIPWGPAAEQIVDTMPLMREALADAGRDPVRVRVMARLRVARTQRGAIDAAATFAAVGEMIDAGVTDFRLRVSVPDGRDEALDIFSTLVQGFRASVP
ncbi:MAG: TIGR03619 family F420-dependent LLM class oxidoreductase [Actinomycetota bacterium]